MDLSWQHRPLPPNWEAKYDPGLARYFYINHATRSTQWNDPRIDYYANQQNMAQSFPMTVMVKPKCATCRDNEVARAGQDCMTCMMKKQQAAQLAREKEEAEKKKKAEEEKKKREETERRRREEEARVREENRRKAEAAKVPKKPTEAMKRDAKRKLAQQFPKASNLVIEMAIETTNCDVEKAAGVLRMLKEDDDPPKTTRKPAEAKSKTSPKKATPKKVSPKKAATKPAQPPGPPASRGVSPSGVSFEVSLSDNVSGSAMPSTSTSQPVRPVQKTQKTSPKKMKGADGRVKFAPVVIKSEAKTFNSHLAVGPNASLVQGHNVDLLIDNYVTEKGQDAELRKGPNPTYVAGPNKELSNNKENLAVGPDPSNVNGPQMLLYQGPVSSGTAL